MSMSAADRHAWTEPAVEDLGGRVYRIPLPLPMDALRAVNVYAIADAEGVDLIDGGIALVAARARLTDALAEIGYELGDIRNFFVTHIHADHYSLAVELRQTLHNIVTLGEGERAGDEDPFEPDVHHARALAQDAAERRVDERRRLDERQPGEREERQQRRVHVVLRFAMTRRRGHAMIETWMH